MQTITRAEQSSFLNSLFDNFEKQAFYIERIGNSAKKDPFEDANLDNVWKIKGSKLFKNISEELT